MTENIVTFLNQGLISKIGRDLENFFIMFNNILKCYLIIYAIYICIQTPVFPTSLVLIFYGLFILSRFHCRPWQLPWFMFRLWSSEQYIALPHFDKNAWNWDWVQWSCLLWVLTPPALSTWEQNSPWTGMWDSLFSLSLFKRRFFFSKYLLLLWCVWARVGHSEGQLTGVFIFYQVGPNNQLVWLGGKDLTSWVISLTHFLIF